MRIGLTVGSIVLWWVVAACPAGDPPRTDRKVGPVRSAVLDALREASEVALKQDEHQRYWCERVLLHIGDVQIRAGDFDGALKSIRGSSYTYGRDERLVKLAQSLARDGKRQRALGVLRLLDGQRYDYVDDGVQLQWIEHLIASGELDQARQAVEQLKSQATRSGGLRHLAIAYAKSGDPVRAAEHFSRAVDVAANSKDEFDRARALWQIAESQVSLGKVEPAKATIRQLVETEPKEPWAKVSALRECAVLAARASDEQTARRLFRRAIEAQPTVNAMNKTGALQWIAIAQADVGYLDDARKTAAMIEHSETDFTQDGAREEALFAVARAQLTANDVEGAVRTALSVKYYLQYRDDALQKIVDHQIAKRDLKRALATAEKFGNSSRKATVILNVATAHAKSGDRKTAGEVAARIELTQADELAEFVGKGRFDYRRPRTWGICYDGLTGTNASRRAAERQAAEVATAAMALAQALGERPAQSYAVLFNEINTEEVTQALARTHAASGDADKALAWARQIGSSCKLSSGESRYHSRYPRAVQRRIHALMGVAEGILDRSSEALPEREP